MNIDEAEKICICQVYPTYFNCGEKLAFCLWENGKSQCMTIESGCIYPGCPVQEKMDLLSEYYCTRGSEKEQTALKKQVQKVVTKKMVL